MGWLQHLPTFDPDLIANELLRQREIVFLMPKPGQPNMELVQAILSRLTQTPASDIKLQRNEHGKPYWPSHSEWHFNVSDSAPWLLIGFSRDRSIGVDIEKERPVRHPDQFPRRMMTEAEQTAFATLSQNARDERLIQYWSMKEAILKCEGGSFFRDAHRIGIRFDPLQIQQLPTEFSEIKKWKIDQTSVKDNEGKVLHISLALKSN